MSQIAELTVPTISFVNPWALSAGSMIAISTDRIYMSPGSKIGSSAIVSGTGQEIDPVMRAKLESFFSAHVRYISEKKGHDPKIMEAMMQLSDEERRFGDVVVKPGQLLALNSTEATKILDDGPLLSVGEVADLKAVLTAEGLENEVVVTATPTGFEKFAWWVASVSGLLILVGLGGGYFELKTPGFGVGGVVSLTAFSLFFFGNYMAGNMANYEIAAIFVLGLILIAVELFVLPGFGIAGITGLFLAVGSLGYAMIDKVTWTQFEWGGEGLGGLAEVLSRPARHVGFGIFGSLVLLYLMMKFLPKVSFIGKQLLPAHLPLGTGQGEKLKVNRVGMTGEAKTNLRPTGKAEIDGEVIEVVADGQYLDAGARVRVVSDDGMGISVKRVE